MATLVDRPMFDPYTGLKYEPLTGSRSFRLDKFVEAAADLEQTHYMRKEFERGSTQCLSYTALSYAWGDSSSKVLMMIKEQLVSVTTNLHEAIVHMCRTLPSINLGVDALSINQGDISERNQQVSYECDIQ
jgi:alpha-glucuronidase